MKGIISLVAIALFSANTHAMLITGTPTDNGSTDPVGIQYSSGKIKYYIPINNADGIPDGQYGVDDYPGIGGDNDYGLVADSGWTDAANPLGGPVLSMSIFFDIPDGMKGDILTLWFGDLDLKLLNTPYGFFETINFIDGLGSITAGTIYDWSVLAGFSDVTVDDNNIAPPNNSDVTVEISGLDLTGPFWLNMEFSSYSENLYGDYWNTKEKLSAELHTSVPEPAVMALFGIGLLGLGFARRRMHS